MPIELHQIVTFAAEAFSGNPAFVLVTEDGISSATLQRIAQHLREPVIASLATLGEGLRLSFSTPTGPHPGAGHAAHAAAHVALTRLRPGHARLELALDDDRRMIVQHEIDGPAVEWPTMPCTAVDALDRVAACIGIRPLETYVAPFGLLAILASSDDVAGAVPDLAAIAALPENTLMITSPDAVGDFAIRVFAPKVGLPEDPVCGTAHRIVVPLWAERLGRTRLVSRQLSPRGGKLFCRLGPNTVTLSGAATPFFSGTILPDLT